MNTIKCFLLALYLAVLLSVAGCATQQPSLISVLTRAPQAVTPANFNDYAIITFWDETLQSYGRQSSISRTVSLGGALTIAALGTAAFATANTPGTSRAFMLGANSLLIAMGILKPTEENGIYAQGSRLLQDALGEYGVALIAAGHCTVPTTFATAQGMVLLQKTLAAQSVVGDMLSQILPRHEDYQKLATVPDKSRALGTRESCIPEPTPNPPGVSLGGPRATVR